MLPSDFENDKRLMMKIGIKKNRKRDEGTENKEIKWRSKINYKKKNLIFKFK